MLDMTRPSPSLISLPPNILLQIALHLDRKSAFSFAYAFRKLTLAAEHVIWRDLHLALPAHFGEYPLVQPCPRGHPDHQAWAKAEWMRVKDRRDMGLGDKARTIMRESSERRMAMVRSMVITLLPGALHPILNPLDAVSPTLRALELCAPLLPPSGPHRRPSQYQTIDAKILDYRMDFPLLTHIRLGAGTVRFSEFLILLCASAVNLTSLIVDAGNELEAPPLDDGLLCRYVEGDKAARLRTTKLRVLSIVYRYRPSDGERCPLIHIIGSSSLLEQVSVKYSAPGPLMADLLDSLSDRSNLRDLSISLKMADFNQYAKRMARDAFPSLRRLVLLASHDLDFLEYLPQLPKLDTLYIQRPTAKPRTPLPTHFPEVVASSTVFPQFATRLWRSSKLRYIHSLYPHSGESGVDIFQQLANRELAYENTGVVRSLVRGDEELIHARLYLHHHELYDQPLGKLDQLRKLEISIPYYARDGQQREVIFAPRMHNEGAWYDHIEYDGYAVPIDILSGMRIADDASVSDWEHRGVAVGRTAWNILLDWRDRQPGSRMRLPPRVR